jgi:hypothetical protein
MRYLRRPRHRSWLRERELARELRLAAQYGEAPKSRHTRRARLDEVRNEGNRAGQKRINGQKTRKRWVRFDPRPSHWKR